MAVNMDVKPKKRGGFWRGCLITLMVAVVLLAVGGGIGWSFLNKEHREARSLPLNRVNFAKLHDGTYHGAYAGGMYKWRANECQVTVTSGKVNDIQYLSDKSAGPVAQNTSTLYDRVIKAQSLQVDTISGATLTSKAYLQCVENALIPAQ